MAPAAGGTGGPLADGRGGPLADNALRDLLQAGRRRLAAAGIDTAALDVRVLVAHVLGLSPIGLGVLSPPPITPPQRRRILRLIARREEGVPVARLTGSREFWSLPFAVGRATLVPRPDSETLVELALAEAGAAVDRVLDLGTGTGCLLLAVLHDRPAATGLGIDRSAGALATARRNAAALGLADRARFRRGDWAQGVTERFDLVLSNPPYIRSAEIADLAAEVRADPIAALDGGDDGLDAYRAIAAALPGLLTPTGLAALEIGWDQGAAVSALLEAEGLAVRGPFADLAGQPRVLLAGLPVKKGLESGGLPA